jgi:hypothetical protein
MKNSNDVGNRTRDLPACSAVPQPPVLLRRLVLSQTPKGGGKALKGKHFNTNANKTHNKMFNSTKGTELGHMERFLYKIKCKCEM